MSAVKISEMVKREDFYKILELTNQTYFGEILKEVENDSQTGGGKVAVFFIFPHLNAIVARKPAASIKMFLLTEYSVRGLWIKNLLARAYTWFMLSTGGLFASCRLKIPWPGLEFDSLLIYPCNKKIRYFHFNRRVVDVVLKHGCKNWTIKREIRARKFLGKQDCVRPLLEFGNTWYREEIIKGIPLARINNSRLVESICLEVLCKMQKINIGFCKEISAVRYSISLANKIRIEMNQFFSNPRFAEILFQVESFLEKLVMSVKELSDGSLIPTVLSHGDLQEGNIWFDKEDGITIIDWETMGRRSVWYDQIVLLYSVRKRKGFIDQIQSIFKHGFKFPNFSGLNLSWKKKNQERVILSIFLLEDFLYEVRETSSLVSGSAGFGLEFYWKNLKILEEALSL